MSFDTMADPPLPERAIGGAPRPGGRCMPAGDRRRPPPPATFARWREPGLRPCPPGAAPAARADRQPRPTAFVLAAHGRAMPFLPSSPAPGRRTAPGGPER